MKQTVSFLCVLLICIGIFACSSNSSKKITDANNVENSASVQEQTLQISVADMIDLVQSWIKDDSKSNEILEKYGYSNKYDSPFDSRFYYKNCKVIPVDEKETINTGKEIEIKQDDLSASVIKIYRDERNLTEYEHVEAIVFDKNCCKEWDIQLKEMGYSPSAPFKIDNDCDYFYQKKGDSDIYIRIKDNSYILEIEVPVP